MVALATGGGGGTPALGSCGQVWAAAHRSVSVARLEEVEEEEQEEHEEEQEEQEEECVCACVCV